MAVIRTTCSQQIQQLKEADIVLTIGVFDGVHVGHRHLIEQTMNLAADLSAECAVYTFWPYPRHVYDQENKLMIYPLPRKYEILENLGVKFVIEQRFDDIFSALNAEEFVRYLLQQMPLLRGICVGADFRFAHARSDDAGVLCLLCKKYGIHCRVVEKISLNGSVVSSTRIRQLITSNDLESAKILLGE